MPQGHFFGETVKRAASGGTRLAVTAVRSWRKRIAIGAFAVLTATGAQAFIPDYDNDFPGADSAGPMLRSSSNNPSVQAYNKAVRLYRRKRYAEALQQMRAAVRAKSFGPQNIGLAFSNLCLMYFRVGKYRNAEAACTRALIVLPGYVPATINLGRAKARLKPPAE